MVRKAGPPEEVDLSINAVEKEVWKRALMSPVTIYPGALGVAGLVGALAFMNPLVLVAGFGFLAVSGGSVVVNRVFRSEAVAKNYIDSQNAKMMAIQEKSLKQFRREIETCSHYFGSKELADRALHQLGDMQRKIKNIENLLGKQLRKTELAYSRIMSAANQVYNNVAENLTRIVNILESASTIDVQDLATRISSGASDKEIELLQEQKHLHNEQLELVAVILTKNEECMLELERTSFKVAAMEYTKDEELEEYIQELQRLSNMVQDLGVKQTTLCV